MADNLESDIKYVPYKELAKKRSLDYYYANKEAISLKRKDKYTQLYPKTRKNCSSITDNGLITNRLKDS